MKAQDKLIAKLNQGKHITVGLDTDIKKIPAHLLKYDDPISEFNKIIIENTAKHAAAYKINFAFYENSGAEGYQKLEKTMKMIPDDILIIGDAKRGDIGNTSQMYAASVFDHFQMDAVTLHPYMGKDSLSPFLNYTDKLSFILALTSNPGAEDFEKTKLTSGKYLYQHIIETIHTWNENENCGIVFGATKIEELQMNISGFANLFILLPGVGAQGGSLEDVASTFRNNNNNRFLVNVSRGLLYIDDTEDFGQKVEAEIIRLNSICA